MVLLIAVGLSPAWSQEARLTNIVVNNTRDDLLLYLNVDGAFSEKIREAVLTGVPVSFSFFINLYRVNTLWLNQRIEALKIVHTIKYNNLKKEFTIQRSWDNGPALVTQSFTQAQNWMTAIDSFAIIALEQLEKGRQYQIRAKAQLNKLTLPFYLHYILFFISLWDFETDWYTIDFLY